MNDTRKLLKIGNVDVSNAKGFAFDGCHKIYVCQTWKEVRDSRKEDWKVYGMNRLQDTFVKACPLRFINWQDLRRIVPQCAMKVTFTYNDGKSVVNFRKPRKEK